MQQSQSQPQASQQAKEADRRATRSAYRDLMNEVEKAKHDLVNNPDDDKILDLLARQEELYDDVENIREGAMDTELFASIAVLGKQRMGRLKVDFMTFDADAFVAKVKRLMDHGSDKAASQTGNDDGDDEFEAEAAPLDWSVIGEVGKKFLRRTPRINLMYGPLMAEVVDKKVVRKKRSLDVSEADKVKPREGDAAITEKTEEKTATEVERLVRHLRLQRASGPTHADVPLFQFIAYPIESDAAPDSAEYESAKIVGFGRTVENIFHLSFLIAQGVAEIVMIEGHPHVHTHSKPDTTAKGNLEKKQTVWTITMAEYEQVVAKYDIREPFLSSGDLPDPCELTSDEEDDDEEDEEDEGSGSEEDEEGGE